MIDAQTLSTTNNATARALRALSAAGPVAEQNLSVISLGPIKASLGDRWPSKRDQIWGQVEAFLRHQFRPEDLVLRLDEISALVVQPGRPRITAQTLAIRAANDLTRFFLGDAPFTDVLVHRVESISDEGLTCTPVPRPQYMAALMARDASAWAPADAWRMPILTRLERNLAVDVSLAPLAALQSGRSGVGHVVRTVITDTDTGLPLAPEDRADVQSSDLAGIDLAVLTTAFERRRALVNNAAPLIVPVSSHSLGHSSLRFTLLQEAHKLPAAERQGFFWEIIDLEAGAPESRIAELVAIARPQCRGVICRMELNLKNAAKLKSAGATLSVASPGAAISEHALLKLEGVVPAVLKLIPSVMIHDLPPELLPVATFIGVTNCTVAPLEKIAGTPRRLEALL